jgi:uncharacterized membrane protein
MSAAVLTAERTLLDRDPDETRVLALLVRNGGQLGQKEIQLETEWSRSKVSQVVTALVADGDLGRAQIGRRNVLYLPGLTAEAALRARSGGESA